MTLIPCVAAGFKDTYERSMHLERLLDCDTPLLARIGYFNLSYVQAKAALAYMTRQ
jgi:hypothetical protein